MSDPTTTTQPPARIKHRTRRAAPRHARQRQRLVNIRHLRARRGPAITADFALHILMQDGDVYRVGRRRYLVAPLSAELLDRLIMATGAHEDLEDTVDAERGDDDDMGADDYGEPSLGQTGMDDLELEEDGREPSLGWANEGPQPEQLGEVAGYPDGEMDHDNEPSLCGVTGTGAGSMDPLDREADRCDDEFSYRTQPPGVRPLPLIRVPDIIVEQPDGTRGVYRQE
jgi:hypothetical protein